MAEEYPELTNDELTNAIATLTGEVVRAQTMAGEAHAGLSLATQLIANMQLRVEALSREVFAQKETIEALEARFQVQQSYINNLKGVPDDGA